MGDTARSMLRLLAAVPSPCDATKPYKTRTEKEQRGWFGDRSVLVTSDVVGHTETGNEAGLPGGRGIDAADVREEKLRRRHAVVNVFSVGSASLAKIVQLETKTIPIVASAAGGDLAAAGLVSSIARPGGAAISQVHRFSAMNSSQGALSFSKHLYRTFQGSHSFRRTLHSRPFPR